MKIVRLTAENIKKLRAVEITPAGEIVTIAGKNGQGKTSVLDSIWWALTGTRNIQGQPIRKGETKARVKLDLGELVVERRFNEAGSTLSVESSEGARFPSPQKMLDALLGELSFDPLAFARMEPRRQFDELRRVAKLDVDIDKLTGLNASDYAKRTELNRDAKAKRAQADGIAIPAEIKEEAVDETGLVDELQKAGETNAEIERRKGRRASAQADADSNKRVAAEATARATALRNEAAALDAKANDFTAMAEETESKLRDAPPLPDPVDVTALRGLMELARLTNAAIAERQAKVERKEALSAEAVGLTDQARELTERMEARDTEKRTAIEKAALPIPGLGFGEGVVTFNGIPFDQASSAEQLRVSMSIAMAANPKLRVIRITDGSLLDEDSLASIGTMAKAADFQVWIETVSSSGKVGVVIDDGAVASTPESRAAEPAEAAT